MGGAGKEQEKKDSSFLKKRSKRLLHGCRGLAGSVRHGQKFFGSFFQKRTFLLPHQNLTVVVNVTENGCPASASS
jgi:hypothetical protein